MRKPDYASGPETPDFSPGSGFIDPNTLNFEKKTRFFQ